MNNMILSIRTFRTALMSAFLLILVACGGGGGGSSSNAPEAEEENSLRLSQSVEINELGIRQLSTVYEYDEQGKVTETVQTIFTPDGVGVAGTSTTTFSYDVNNRLTALNNETLFSDGTVESNDLTITFEDSSSVQINEISSIFEAAPDSSNFSISFAYIDDRAVTAQLTGFSIIGTSVEPFDIDFTITNLGAGTERLISRLVKVFNMPSSILRDNNVVEYEYRNNYVERLEETANGQSITEQIIERTETEEIRTTSEAGPIQVTTLEYEEGICLPQDDYLLQLIAAIDLFSVVPETQCRS